MKAKAPGFHPALASPSEESVHFSKSNFSMPAIEKPLFLVVNSLSMSSPHSRL